MIKKSRDSEVIQANASLISLQITPANSANISTFQNVLPHKALLEAFEAYKSIEKIILSTSSFYPTKEIQEIQKIISSLQKSVFPPHFLASDGIGDFIRNYRELQASSSKKRIIFLS